jgi:DNA-binding response OmpR family regulator
MQSPSSRRRRPIVLVIEPHADTRQMWKSVLRLIHCRPIAVATAAEAQAAIARVTPDLVVTELALPDAPGAEICSRLRSLSGMETVPILVVTSWVDAPGLAAAKDAGADLVLTKPLTVDELIRAVRRLIRR